MAKKNATEAKQTAERTARYVPKDEAIPMRAGTVSDMLAQAMLAEGGATIDAMKASLVEKFGDPDKFSTNYVSGYIWDLGRRGYGIDVDGESKFYLVLPKGAEGLSYQAEKPKAEPKAAKAEKAPKAETAAKPKGKGKKTAAEAAPAASGGDDDAGEAQTGDAPQTGE